MVFQAPRLKSGTRVEVWISVIWLWCTPCMADDIDYRLTMMPIFSSAEIQNRIAPVAQYLSQETGLRIETVVTNSFETYGQLSDGERTISFSNPVYYASGSGRHKAIAIASKGEQGSRFRGLIVTRRDSNIKQISDLKGKTVGYNGKRAGAAHLSQRLTLLEHGLDTLRDLQLTLPVNNKQENTLLAVYVGDIDAGFVRESALKSVQTYIPLQSLVVLEETAWIPQWALSVSEQMPEAHRQAILLALTRLNSGHSALQALEIDAFKVASDSDFDALRRAIPN